MNILVCSTNASFFERSSKMHYSLWKSLGFSLGLANNGHKVYMLSKEYTENYMGVQYVRSKNVDLNFIKKLDIIFFTRENSFQRCIDNSPGISEYLNLKLSGKKISGPKIVIKTAKETFLSKTDVGIKKYCNIFDYFILQEKSLAISCKSNIKRFSNAKVNYSTMGTLISPYKFSSSPYNKNKINILYMGRMRQNPSRMPFLINIAKKLGDSYNLNILPGTFSKPNHPGRNKWGPEKEEPFNWLCDYFSVQKNIKIHKPIDWGPHWDYIYSADVGIDFSPHEKNSVYPVGNAKLLEYLTAGLPSVTEYTTGNAHLISDCNGGDIVRKVRDIDEYCNSIRKVANSNYKRKDIANITIKNHSWNKKAEEVLRIIKNNEEI